MNIDDNGQGSRHRAAGSDVADRTVALLESGGAGETITISGNSPAGRGGAAEEKSIDSGLVSSGLRQAFATLIPLKPYCTDDHQFGLQIRPQAIALQKRHVQLNGPATFQWMAHDIDYRGAYFAHEDANIPPPNVIMLNPENGHAHSAYLMATPIARHSASRIAPLKFFAAVERGVARRIKADRGYSGLIVKNPMHPHWRVEWRRDESYELHELAGYLFDRDMRPDQCIETTFGAGRNITVFDELRAIAYREVREHKANGAVFNAWLSRCIHVAVVLNQQFPVPMKTSEVRSIGKSVAGWTWEKFSNQLFRSRQSHLGKKGMAKRWEGHQAASNTKPWRAQGISRATYYRWRRAAKNPSGAVRRIAKMSEIAANGSGPVKEGVSTRFLSAEKQRGAPW